VSRALEGKVAIVTGAGRGVGRAYAHALAREGAAVVVNDLPARNGAASSAAAVVAEIEAFGGRAVANHASVADFEHARGIVENAIEAFGAIDILIANAGNMRPAFLREASESDWAEVMAVHANGTFNTARHAAERMIEASGGSIVTTGDLSTDLMFPRDGAYRAAKAAIAVFTLYLADELRDHNINVNSIMPGATETRMMRTYFESLGDAREAFLSAVRERYQGEATEGARPATPESVPPLGVYLCTDAARQITGRLFALKHSTIRVFAPSGEVSSLQRDDDQLWTTDALGAAVPAWLESLEAPIQ
jgi:NAD(P)-dependent dehydrogenase (short-subunit alcohol dehydrogenase family)